MARNDALLRLHKSLTARRDELRKRIGGELKDLRSRTGDTWDNADMAFDTAGEEVISQLAQLEARELTQIDRALVQLRQGTYGVCEHCSKRIPVARLNALPYSTTCIQCQREMELHGTWGESGDGDWDKVSDSSSPLEDQREVNLADLEVDFSANR